MQTNTELQRKGMQAGVFLARESMFMNSPDVAQQVVTANTENTGTIAVSQGSIQTFILGVLVLNDATTFYAINDLANDKYRLKQPIIVMLRQDDDGEWIATFSEAELSRSGETLGEALDWLKASMVELYELFSKESKLGPLPRRQFQALGQYIGQKPHRAK